MCLILPTSYVFDKSHPFRLSPSLPANDLHFDWIDRDHPDRESIEHFISEVFRNRFGAEVQYFSDVLVGSRDAGGQWNSAVGLSSIAQRPAFLEQYLDRPVEQIISVMQTDDPHRHPVARTDIVEFGNLAATRPGIARALILHLAPFLHARNVRWIVFTGVQSLFNSFAKLNYQPIAIAPADPQRLNATQDLWGSYYDASPKVMYGDVDAAYASLFQSSH